MEIVRSKSIGKPVIFMKILNDESLVVVDSETTVRFFNKNNLELKSGFKVGIKHKHYSTQVMTVSNNGEYFSTMTTDCKESKLFETESKEMVTALDRHHGEVSCVGIDPLSRYMFSCGDDGKTFAIDVKTGKLVFTLPPHADTINDITFSKNGNWVATASYDRKISLFSLVTMTPKNKLKAHSAPVMKVKFFQKNKLMSIDKKSSVIIWNIYNGKLIQRLEGIHDDVTALTMDEEEKFLFLGTKLGYIIVFDLNTYKMISQKYIKITSPITTLEFDAKNNYLILGTEDGFIICYNVYEGVDTLTSLLKEKKFDLIQKNVDLNPLLEYTQIYDLLSHFWEKSLEKATLALQNGDKKRALIILSQFKHMSSKNKIIQKLLHDYEEFPKFSEFAKAGKLALAYGLVNKYPVYKESALYNALEERWKKAISQAQKYVLVQKTVPLAKEILAPYRGISEKTILIQDVLTKADIYKRFRVAISKKAFKVCSELIKQNAFLRELPEYHSLMKYADNLYIKSQKLTKEGDLHASIKLLRVLQDFDDFKDVARNFMIDLEAKAKFFNAIRDDDFDAAYNMMVISEDLMSTDDGIKLNNIWNKDLNNANAYAAAGNIEGVKATLKKYMKTSSKYMALATVFAFSYMVQLENALQNDLPKQKIENGIKNYMLNFGQLEQIETFFNLFIDMYPDSKLNLEFLTKGSLSMWRPSMIVDSILE